MKLNSVDIDEVIENLLDSYKAFYNISILYNENHIATCEYYEHSEKYVISKKAELWSANSEEFLYLYKFDRLTLEDFNQVIDFVYDDGMNRAHIGPGHMYTYITPIFVCNECDEDALKAIKKCKIYKSFRFSFHGWMDFHTAVIEIKNNKISTNASGRCMEKGLKKVLYTPKKKIS